MAALAIAGRSPWRAAAGRLAREETIMPEDKARKIATRQRMAETGEPYSVARRAVEDDHDDGITGDAGTHAAGNAGTHEAGDAGTHEAGDAGSREAQARAHEHAVQARELAEQARHFAEQARERAERAEEDADRAQEAADQAEESADQADEAADEAEDLAGDFDDEAPRHVHRHHRSHRPPRPPRPARPGRPVHRHHYGPPESRRVQPDRDPAERLQDRVEQVIQRFEVMRDRADRLIS